MESFRWQFKELGFLSLETREHWATHPTFYMDAKHLNLGSLDCEASSLSTEPSL